MEANHSGPLVPDRGTSGAGPSLPGAVAVRSAALASDAHQLDRMLLGYAVHEDGGGMDRARLFVCEPVSGDLVPWRGAERGADRSPLEQLLDRARLAEPWGPFDPSASRSATLAPEELEGPAAKAFHSGVPQVGDDGKAGTPWTEATVGAALLRHECRPYALLVGSWDGATPDTCRARLADWVAVAEAMIENHARERARRTQEAHVAALAELGRLVASPANLSEVLHLTARLAAHACGAEGSAVWLADDAGVARLEVTYGPAGGRERRGRALARVAAEAIRSRRVIRSERPTDEFLLSPDAAADLTAFAVHPMAAYDAAVGAIAVYNPPADHPAVPAGFTASDRVYLGALADLSAVAVDQSQRHRDLNDAEHRGRELGARLRREEHAAILGESALRALQEARNPVASIKAFARRAAEELPPDDTAHEYLEIALREAERLERMLGAGADPGVLELPRLRFERVNDVIQEVLQRVGETLVRRRVRLIKKLGADVPPLLLDPDRMRQVIGAIVDAALGQVGTGGRIRIESRLAQHHVVVEIGHDGGPGPGEALDQLFGSLGDVPGGGGLALAVAQRLVREHGGEIRVRSEGEWRNVVALSLPVAENGDRRRNGPDRRGGRPDRRGRFPSD